MKYVLGLVLLGIFLQFVSCEKDDLVTEEELIQNFLKVNDIEVEPLPSGLYYIDLITGTGDLPVYLDTVKVEYQGSFVSGQIFDQGTIDFVVGIGEVIRGWDEGITFIRVGGRAMLIVPSKLGYGSMGSYRIPGNTPLVFQMKLVSIRNGPNHF